jgi:hypothetical protein
MSVLNNIRAEILSFEEFIAILREVGGRQIEWQSNFYWA